MIESWELPNRSELIEYLRHYRYDRFHIVDMWEMKELPEFVYNDFFDGNELADEVLGTGLSSTSVAPNKLLMMHKFLS